MVIFNGRFYEFHKERVISRPGAPMVTRPGFEIGPEIAAELALSRVRAGKDVYTLAKEDAKQLAMRVGYGLPADDLPHQPAAPTQSLRDDVYYRHFHPGGVHPDQPGGP